MTGVLRGHFLAPSSEDAILGMEGCVPHGADNGGSFLLTLRSGKWLLVWWKEAIITEHCRRVRGGDGRDLLVCEGAHDGQGNWDRYLGLLDLKAPKVDWESVFFQVNDTVGACGFGPESEPTIRAYIDRVDFTSQGLTVEAWYGRINPTSQQLEECRHSFEQTKLYDQVPMKPYSIDFLFDGKTYRVAPASRAAAALFQGK